MNLDAAPEQPGNTVSLFLKGKGKEEPAGLEISNSHIKQSHRAFEWLALFMASRREKDDGGTQFDNPRIPSGYTYLGQLISHDLTLTKRSLEMGPSGGKTAETNGRSPILDLDTIYGGGPLVSPDLYERGDATGASFHRTKFQLGWTRPVLDQKTSQNDLPRTETYQVYLNGHGDNDQTHNQELLQTRVCDKRNEDNLIMSQLTVLLYRLHNKFVDEVFDATVPRQKVFEAARWLTANAYRNIVKHDFLPLLLGEKVSKAYKSKDLPEFALLASEKSKCVSQGFSLPIEFTMAAMRVGHVMVRNIYPFPTGTTNPNNVTLFEMLRFQPLYRRSEDTGHFIPVTDSIPLVQTWVVKNWNFFFPSTGYKGAVQSKAIKAAVASHLAKSGKNFPPSDVLGSPINRKGGLVFRDLARAFQNGVPNGFALARRLGIKTIEKADLRTLLEEAKGETFKGWFEDHEVSGIIDFIVEEPPLMFFLLAEAEIKNEGEMLGPLGAHIVAESIYPALILGQMRDGDTPELVLNLPSDKQKFLIGFNSMPDVLEWVEGDDYAKHKALLF